MTMTRRDYQLIADALAPLVRQDGPASYGARLAAEGITRRIKADKARYGNFDARRFAEAVGLLTH